MGGELSSASSGERFTENGIQSPGEEEAEKRLQKQPVVTDQLEEAEDQKEEATKARGGAKGESFLLVF